MSIHVLESPQHGAQGTVESVVLIPGANKLLVRMAASVKKNRRFMTRCLIKVTEKKTGASNSMHSKACRTKFYSYAVEAVDRIAYALHFIVQIMQHTRAWCC